MSVVKKGHNVKVHYKGTFEDGTEFDNSRQRGSTIEFQVGAGQMIKGFDDAVSGMSVGEVKTVTIASDDAYGDVNPEAVQEFSKTAFPDDFDFNVGEVVQGSNSVGQPMIAKITAVADETVTLDLNHPLAGKDLTFEIELIDVESTDVETADVD